MFWILLLLNNNVKEICVKICSQYLNTYVRFNFVVNTSDKKIDEMLSVTRLNERLYEFAFLKEQFEARR